jgi:hypothetical protein
MLGIVGLALSQRGIETDQTTRRLTQRRQILKPSSLTHRVLIARSRRKKGIGGPKESANSRNHRPIGQKIYDENPK